MRKGLTEYFRCTHAPGDFTLTGCLSQESGYFSFGPDIVCYGKTCPGVASEFSNSNFRDVLADVRLNGSIIQLPFDPDEVVDNLRFERYLSPAGNRYGRPNASLIHDMYYLVRPLLPKSVRKHLQRAYLTGWQRLSFPKWPVDTTVDNLLERLLALSIRSAQMRPVPFVWFWPDGATAAAIMTHDVETEKGVQLSASLMDVDQSFGIPASFQIVPEQRYKLTEKYLSNLRERGFEVNVQDLNHDGRLFSDWAEFKRRVAKINQYGRELGAGGFRSAVLYRDQDWYNLLEFEYDMSVPNVGHLEAQRGGCCTVMPYFVGDVLELPVTTTQDYSLFYILRDYSLDLWERQTDLIMEKHGLISFVVHPDYIFGGPELRIYKDLLSYLIRLRAEKNVWIATPGEVNHWWRQRAQMTPVEDGDGWRIEGPGSERARIAYAVATNGQLEIAFQ
jgi:hypothetical protein